MEDKTIKTVLNILVYTVLSAIIAVIALLFAMAVKETFFDTDNSVHTESICVENHSFIVFYDSDNEVKHIEHSPGCKCFSSIEYD